MVFFAIFTVLSVGLAAVVANPVQPVGMAQNAAFPMNQPNPLAEMKGAPVNQPANGQQAGLAYAQGDALPMNQPNPLAEMKAAQANQPQPNLAVKAPGMPANLEEKSPVNGQVGANRQLLPVSTPAP